MFRRTLVAAAGAAALVASAGIAQAQIRIATVGPMTGQYAAFGAQMRAGAEQAIADINAAGGVLGQQLVLEVGDDACDPRQAVSVANQLAGRGVRFVAGHFCSGSSIPASKVYQEEGVLQISPASTNPKFTDVQLLAINDLHGHLQPNTPGTIQVGCCTPVRDTAGMQTGWAPKTVAAGGIAYLATWIKQLRTRELGLAGMRGQPR